jgi:hypothetical protein
MNNNETRQRNNEKQRTTTKRHIETTKNKEPRLPRQRKTTKCWFFGVAGVSPLVFRCRWFVALGFSLSLLDPQLDPA